WWRRAPQAPAGRRPAVGSAHSGAGNCSGSGVAGVGPAPPHADGGGLAGPRRPRERRPSGWGPSGYGRAEERPWSAMALLRPRTSRNRGCFGSLFWKPVLARGTSRHLAGRTAISEGKQSI